MFRTAVTFTLAVWTLAHASAPACAQSTTPTTTTRPAAVPAPITTIDALHRLTAGQAARQRPVKLRGVVTYLSAAPGLMFVQAEDGAEAFCVAGPRDRDARQLLKPGASVEVEGVTAAGRSGVYVVGVGKEPARVQIVSEAVSVVEPAAVSLEQVERSDGLLVECEAVVRSVQSVPLGGAQPDAMVVKLSDGRDVVEAALVGRKNDGAVSADLVGATVRVRGVFNAVAPERQHPAAGRLLLRSARDVRVVTPAAPPFELPAAAVATLRSGDASPASTARARVRGVVTLPMLARGMYVQSDDGGGLWVSPSPANLRDARAARAGDRVDVVGFPSRLGWAAALDDAVWRTEDRGGAPPAGPLRTPDQLLGGDLDGSLVRLEALVLSVSRLTEGPTLVLQSADRVFLARLPNATPAAAAPDSVRDGSWVRVTGVCVNNRAPGDVPPPEPAPAAEGKPVSFHLLLASPASVEVITAPSPWTLRRVLLACAALAVAALAALAWVVALRRRVARQTGLIREHLARQTLYEERARIARDLHDSLQQDLLGITMQLTATEKLLDRPEQASRSLKLAAAMVRRSQAETHRTVWDLRERQLGRNGLVATLREAVAALDPGVTGGGGPRSEVRVSGEARALPSEIEDHVLRVALEAVTNAVKHAGASKVEVTVDFAPSGVELRVTDDGKGFDADRPPPPSAGHFGLVGMRERAEKVRGELSVRSKPGEGTEVRLAVNTGTNGHAAS